MAIRPSAGGWVVKMATSYTTAGGGASGVDKKESGTASVVSDGEGRLVSTDVHRTRVEGTSVGGQSNCAHGTLGSVGEIPGQRMDFAHVLLISLEAHIVLAASESK